MEIPAWLFFSFWALVSIAFLHLGFCALDKTELSNSVSPVIMSLFKHSLAISSCCSSGHALIFRPQSMDDVLKPYLWVALGIFSVLYHRAFEWSFLWGVILSGLTLYTLVNFLAWLLGFLQKLEIFADRYSLIKISWGALLRILIATFLLLPAASFPFFIPIFTLINFLLVAGDNSLDIQVKTRIAIHMAAETSLCFVSGGNTDFFPILVLFLSFSISAFRAALSGFDPLSRVYGYPSLGVEFFKKLLPLTVFSTLKEKTMRKMIAFAVNMLGTLLFQNFFRLTTFNHVVAFLYLAVMWLANLALLGVSSDFGVFNFLMGNVVVGCTVNQFGLRGTTWLAYGASLLLFGLRLKLQSSTLLHRQGEHIQVTLWFESSSSLLPTRGK